LVPTIGNNVSLGVNVTIVGKVTIGDNVTIGAGSVVVKDIPSNCVAVGNPAKVVKYITEPAES
jgi:acetyltransferase-like isoleucine patch superfamily enzyme